MIRSSLCDYSDAYILVKRTKTVPTTGAEAASNNRNKKVIFKICAPLTDCISEINNKEIAHAKDNDVVMLMHNLIEYNENYQKTSGSLRKYQGSEPYLNIGATIDVPDDPYTVSFKYKQKITGQTGDDEIKYLPIMLLLKYLRNFWKTFEMPLINCELIFL